MNLTEAVYFLRSVSNRLGRPHFTIGARGGAVGCGTAPRAGRSRVRFQIASLEFFIDIIRPHCVPGVDSAPDRNEYQEYPRGSKGGWCVGLTAAPTVMKSGSVSLSVCLSVRPSIHSSTHPDTHPLHLESQPPFSVAAQQGTWWWGLCLKLVDFCRKWGFSAEVPSCYRPPPPVCILFHVPAHYLIKQLLVVASCHYSVSPTHMSVCNIWHVFSETCRPAVGPTWLPMQWVLRVISWGSSGLSVKLTTHLHLILRLGSAKLFSASPEK